MRVWMTGGTGFVGSNIMMQAIASGDEVMTTTNSFTPPPDAPYRAERIDMLDREGIARSVAEFDPDLVIHCAISNDHAALYDDRRQGWSSYVDATRFTHSAAEAVDAPFVLISTDWVFDGTQGGAEEDTPPNPINLYGMFKFASEMITIERGGAVARVSGVNGLHQCRPQSPRAQDPGFGYFVASLVDAVRADQPFTVWESEGINMIATPSLASQCGEIVLDIGRRHLSGIFHCCGADAVGRMELAELACDVFELDRSLVRSGPPQSDMLGMPIPYDTSLSRPRTTDLLQRPPTPVAELLARFREEYEAHA